MCEEEAQVAADGMYVGLAGSTHPMTVEVEEDDDEDIEDDIIDDDEDEDDDEYEEDDED